MNKEQVEQIYEYCTKYGDQIGKNFDYGSGKENSIHYKRYFHTEIYRIYGGHTFIIYTQCNGHPRFAKSHPLLVELGR